MNICPESFVMEGVPQVNLVSILFQDCEAPQFTTSITSSHHNGRVAFVKWVIESLLAHPQIGHYYVFQQSEFDGLNKLEYRELAEILTGRSIWFEPARHYSWRASLARIATGTNVPIVTLLHSITYGNQLLENIASLAVGTRPGDVIVAPSQLIKDAFINQCKEIVKVLSHDIQLPTVEVIPYGVPQVPTISKRFARWALAWQQDETVLLYFGRINLADKINFDILVETVKGVHSEGKRLRVVIAGAGNQEAESHLRRKAQPGKFALDIRMNVSELEKHMLYAASDVFLSPVNVVESFGLTVVEAMLHGKPVVCSRVGGYRELIRHGIDGYLVDSQWNECRSEQLDWAFLVDESASVNGCIEVDVRQLIAYTQALIHNPELRERLGENGKSRANALFLLSVFTQRLVQLFERSSFHVQDAPSVAIPPEFLRMASVLQQTAEIRGQSEQGVP